MNVYTTDKKLQKEDVLRLMDWAKVQAHLPKITEIQMASFLYSCYYDTEATKKCVDNYYTTRTLCPEFFAKRNLQNPDLRAVRKVITASLLPKKTPEGYTVYYYEITDTNPDLYDVVPQIKLFDMMLSYEREKVGWSEGLVIVVDMKAITLKHVWKVDLGMVKKYMFFLQEALPVRIKGFHMINSMSIVETFLSLLKPMMNKELLEVFHLHSGTNETLFNFVPKDCLPENVGGNCGKLAEISELQMILFLHSCYYSNEAAKKCIDNYYTVRKMCPEFFANRNPQEPELARCMRAVVMTPLPKLTPDGNRLIDTNPDAYSFTALLKLFDMVASLSQQQLGTSEAHMIVVDLGYFTLSHMIKMNILAIKKYMFFLQEDLPFRLKGLHYDNAVPFMDKLLGLVKPFMKKDLLEVLHTHQGNNETLYSFVPKDCLPQELGGPCGSINDIHENYMKDVRANADYFVAEEKLVADESKRPGKPRSENDLFGVEGTFKKLEID